MKKENQILPEPEKVVHRNMKYSKAIAEKVIAGICRGELLEEICNFNIMPAPARVRQWVVDNPEFRKKFEDAQDMQADHFFEEAVCIAKKTQSGATAKDRLRIDTLLKAAAIRKPKMYGDKKEIGFLVPVVINTSLDVPQVAVSTNEPYTIQRPN